MQRTTITLAIVVLGTPLAHAQGEDLTGVDSVRIVVETLGQPATACGLSADAIRLAAAEGFLEGDLTVSEASGSVIAYVQSTTMFFEDEGGCASAYEISLRTSVTGTPSLIAEPVSGLLPLEDRRGTVLSGRGSHRTRVASALSKIARDLATAIQRAKPRAPETTVAPAAPGHGTNRAYRIARCQELLSSPRLVPPETRARDLRELACHELVTSP